MKTITWVGHIYDTPTSEKGGVLPGTTDRKNLEKAVFKKEEKKTREQWLGKKERKEIWDKGGRHRKAERST